VNATCKYDVHNDGLTEGHQIRISHKLSRIICFVVWATIEIFVFHFHCVVAVITYSTFTDVVFRQWSDNAQHTSLHHLALSCVQDTLGHTLTPIFSVKGVLLCFLPRSPSGLVVSLLSGFSQPSLSIVCLPIRGLFWQSVIIHLQDVS